MVSGKVLKKKEKDKNMVRILIGNLGPSRICKAEEESVKVFFLFKNILQHEGLWIFMKIFIIL